MQGNQLDTTLGLDRAALDAALSAPDPAAADDAYYRIIEEAEAALARRRAAEANPTLPGLVVKAGRARVVDPTDRQPRGDGSAPGNI